MPLVSAGVDGVQNIIPGWTDQSTSPFSTGLESTLGPSPTLLDPPNANGYVAWSIIPEDAIGSNTHATTVGNLIRVFAPANGAVGHLDLVCSAGASITNAVFGLYSGASFATGPLAWTGQVSASIIASATAPVALTWNGASSPASVTLVGGQSYWIYYELTFTGSATFAASAGLSAASMNPNLTATASVAGNAMTLAAGGPTTLAANTTLTPQTSWAMAATKTWFGLRA